VALLAMEGSPLLTPARRRQVAKYLADDVLAHLNHTTTGIISWKAQVSKLLSSRTKLFKSTFCRTDDDLPRQARDKEK
jgi:hypothetical protein